MSLDGLKIVLTGKFSELTRKEAQTWLEHLGADVTGSVSSKTRLLVAGKKAGSKLHKAHKLGLPVLDEHQLLRLLKGAPLEELLAEVQAATEEQAAPKAAAVPFPAVIEHPRNGAFSQTPADGSRIEGSYENGLREGSWKAFWPSGQLKEDYGWHQGLQHGQELDWAEDGTQLCQGQNACHKRQGTWTSHHRNGAFCSTRTYNEQGEQHGPYVWDLDDGRQRARGQYAHDKQSGDWTWWHEPNHCKVVRGFDTGRTTVDAAWHSEDQLAHRFERDPGRRKHGLEQSFYPDGKPEFRGEWAHGVPVGTHTSWDEQGNMSEEAFELGLPQSLRANAKLAERTANKLRKAKDNYKKYDVLRDAVDYDYEGRYLVWLWRERIFDTAADPETWDKLPEAAAVFTGELLMAFLGSIKGQKFETGYEPPHLPYWPGELDQLVLDVYQRDPGPIDAGWRALPPAMMKGVASCIARFGVDIGKTLHGELDQLVRRHVNNYGLGETIHWPAEGQTHIEERQLFQRGSGRHTEHFQRYIELFGGMARWVNKLRTAANKRVKEDKDLDFNLFRAVIDNAPAEELVGYISHIALIGDTQDQIHDALEQGGHSAEELEQIALGIEDSGLRRWPALCTAVLGFQGEGKPVPQSLVDAFELATESPTYSSSWFTDPLGALPQEHRANPHQIDRLVPTEPGACAPRMRLMHQALAAMSPEQRRAIFERQLGGKWSKLDVCPYLYLDPELELLQRVLPLIESESYGTRETNMFGLGELGARGLPLLLQAHKKSKKKALKQAYQQSIIVALARMLVDGDEVDPTLDRHVTFDVIKKDYTYRFLEPYIARIIHRLPRERAEAILLQGLSGKTFHRAFRCVPSHPTQPVLQAAFSELLAQEKSLQHEQLQAVQQGLAGLHQKRDWIKWLLQSGGGAGCKQALQGALGHKALEELEQELQDAGVEAAREMDQVDKIVHLAKQAAGSGERIYLLRRLRRAPGGDELNLVYGAAPGVDAERWPTFDDEPMHHLFTLDLATMPELAARVGGEARTLSLFISDPGDNEAYEADNDETALVTSTQAQIDDAPAPPEGAPLSREQHCFQVVPVDVDPGIWNGDSELRSEIYRASARVLGEPIWLQSDESAGSFYLQFDEGFVDVNLGDAGVMYVFDDTAFWQCH